MRLGGEIAVLLTFLVWPRNGPKLLLDGSFGVGIVHGVPGHPGILSWQQCSQERD
jgi:hypothetical protein